MDSKKHELGKASYKFAESAINDDKHSACPISSDRQSMHIIDSDNKAIKGNLSLV